MINIDNNKYFHTIQSKDRSRPEKEGHVTFVSGGNIFLKKKVIIFFAI